MDKGGIVKWSMLCLIGFVRHSRRRHVKDAEMEDEPVERFEPLLSSLCMCGSV